MREAQMKEFWNTRYAESGYAYGTEPNVFLREQLAKLPPGRLLLPAEGEGRNAAFALSLGWTVDAYDLSEEGRRKAFALAESHGAADRLTYTVGDLAEAAFTPHAYDAVALIFVHLPEPLRTHVHAACINALKPGGVIILEAFTPNQIGRSSGGPQSADRLYTAELLRRDFEPLSIELLEETETVLDEGRYHSGESSVVRLLARA